MEIGLHSQLYRQSKSIRNQTDMQDPGLSSMRRISQRNQALLLVDK